MLSLVKCFTRCILQPSFYLSFLNQLFKRISIDSLRSIFSSMLSLLECFTRSILQLSSYLNLLTRYWYKYILIQFYQHCCIYYNILAAVTADIFLY